jgi:hypothetical protein
MILRRVIAHFRKQEWTAIGLDFIIVVVGVFVGVQVNSWWAGQSDERRETAYLAALKQDFSLVIAELEGDVVEYEEIAKAMTLLLEQSRKHAPDAAVATLNAAARRLISMEGTPIVSDTYSNLTGSGDLAIIKSQTVKNALSSFFAQAEIINLVGNTHEMQLVNVFQPYIVENLDYAGMLREDRDIAPVAGFDPDLILSVLPTQKFRNVVAVKWDIVTDIRGVILTALDDARKVDALLTEELEKTEP